MDARGRVGTTYPGFAVMNQLLVAPGGVEKGGLLPFDLIRAVNGQLVTRGHEVQAEVRRHPLGTRFHYLVSRRGTLLEAEIPSRALGLRDLKQYLTDGLLPSLLYLGLAAVVLALRPGVPETRVFLFFSLTWFCTAALFPDSWTAYRFSALFLTAWAFAPAAYLHIALRFPRPRPILFRRPWLLLIAYLASAVLALAIQLPMSRMPPAWTYLVPAVAATYWALAFMVLVGSLVQSAWWGATPLIRQRAKVLTAGFVAGPLLPVLGTAAEAVTGAVVPYLEQIWRLNVLFPAAVAYGMVRYDLFDLRAAIRTGTVYAAVTGLVVVAYAGAITLVNVSFARLGMGESLILPAVVVALAVVLFLNPVYQRTQGLVDRLFFRERLDIGRTMEQVADTMTTLLDLNRIVLLITETADRLLHPHGHALLLLDADRNVYRPMGADSASYLAVPADGPLARLLGRRPIPLTRERLAADPEFSGLSETALASLDAMGATLVVPVMFRGSVRGSPATSSTRARWRWRTRAPTPRWRSRTPSSSPRSAASRSWSPSGPTSPSSSRGPSRI